MRPSSVALIASVAALIGCHNPQRDWCQVPSNPSQLFELRRGPSAVADSAGLFVQLRRLHGGVPADTITHGLVRIVNEPLANGACRREGTGFLCDQPTHGDRTVHVQAIGYVPWKDSILVRAGFRDTLVIAMTAQAVCLSH